MQVRLLVRGADTVLGDAASDEELFATETLQTRSIPHQHSLRASTLCVHAPSFLVPLGSSDYVFLYCVSVLREYEHLSSNTFVVLQSS